MRMRICLKCKKDSQLDHQYLELDNFFQESDNHKFIGEMFEVCYMQRLFNKKFKSIHECFDSKELTVLRWMRLFEVFPKLIE